MQQDEKNKEMDDDSVHEYDAFDGSDGVREDDTASIADERGDR